jgi:chloride channel protein, CIC family
MEQTTPERKGGRSFSFARLRAAAIPELDLRYLGRVLLHAVLVGAVAGAVGTLFFIALEYTQSWVLEGLVGYKPLRAAGEALGRPQDASQTFRPWLLVVVPALGALAGGVLTAFVAPEAQGGGGNAILKAFHQGNGVVRRRVPGVKFIASILTLGAGGSGGREGPTMQVGGAIGSLMGRYLRVPPRERRILLVAGVAAGMAAVFRTPLGAALLAVEILYRDDFESDALIPALLASVVSYSVTISVLGESKLFAHAPSYPFVPGHLPLYAIMAVLLASLSAVFVNLLSGVQKLGAASRLPTWLRPGLGGLALGICATPIVVLISPYIGQRGQGLGIFGGGYGAAQVAITGASWLPGGWASVELLLIAGFAKIVATSLTVGSGGSAGDFGPSLVMGGLFGSAFGHVAQLLLHDPRIDPGAFALVGMGTFFGGIAHVPVGSLVMVCELAGSYDLLVPLMLAEAIAFVALRHRSLYGAQVASKRESTAEKAQVVQEALGALLVRHVALRDRPYVTFRPATPATEVMQKIGDSSWQCTFPVLGKDGKVQGLVNADVLRAYVAERDFVTVIVAADLMQAPVAVTPTDKIQTALALMVEHHLREIPVMDDHGAIDGFLDESEIALLYSSAVQPESGR